MMNIAVPENLKDRNLWIDVFLYAVLIILAAVIFCYGVLEFKIYFYNTKIKELDDKIAAYSTPEEKAHEAKVLEYKKKLDDFSTIMANHKLSSNIFDFIEKNTLPNVWFSNFSMTGSSGEVRVSGEAKDMETVSRQFRVFETSKEYIKMVTVLNTQVGNDDKVSFILNIILEPNIFTYANQ